MRFVGGALVACLHFHLVLIYSSFQNKGGDTGLNFRTSFSHVHVGVPDNMFGFWASLFFLSFFFDSIRCSLYFATKEVLQLVIVSFCAQTTKKRATWPTARLHDFALIWYDEPHCIFLLTDHPPEPICHPPEPIWCCWHPVWWCDYVEMIYFFSN